MSDIKTKTGIIAIIAILALIVSAAAGSMVTQDVAIRGSVVDGNGTYEYDYTSFAGFWYDLDKNRSSEVMTVNVTGERTIAEKDLVYNCTRQFVSYKNDDLNGTYGGYYIIGFMAEKYICYDDNTDELVKLLIEWGKSDDLVLSMDDPMELPEGYMMKVQEIDLEGGKCVMAFFKDDERLDTEIVEGGNAYTYEDEDDVLVFGLTVDSVFRGTESNLVTVSGIFLRSEDILDIDNGDSFGVMEVRSTTKESIKLSNDESMDLGMDDEVEIMDGLYFKVADSDTLRYYLAKTVSLECPECPECPEIAPCPPCDPCPEPVNTTVLVPDVKPTDAPVETPPTEDTPDDSSNNGTLPGFEAVFAIAGLLAVAYLVLRQRE